MRYVIEVDLTEEDPSEVLDWIIDLTDDENAAVYEADDVKVSIIDTPRVVG